MRYTTTVQLVATTLVFSLSVDTGQSVAQSEDLSLESPCPKSCSCLYTLFPNFQTELFTVNCSGAELSRFPSDTPNTTEALLFSNNRMMNLTSLPSLPRIQLLDLSHNQIQFLDNHWVFEHMSVLKELDLSGNFLRILKHGSFSGLQSLDILNLSENNIRTIELHAFGGLNHLSVLHLEHNDLYELKRSWLLSMTSLCEVYLQGNHISVIEESTFDKHSSLLHLDISDNALRKVSDNGFLGLEKVKVLKLSDNDLLRIPTQELQRLTNVDIIILDGIKADTLLDGELSDLSVISLSLSFLPNLKAVERGAFSNMSRLRTLQLHDNPKLIFIHPQAFRHVPFLRELFLHNNQLIALPSSVRESLPNLEELHLYHNPLHCDCNVFWLKKDIDLFASANKSDGYIKMPDLLACNSPDNSIDTLLSQVSLSLLPPVCPPTTLPFFSSSLNVSIGDDLNLECQAIGIPEPVVSWILPNGQTVNSSTGSNITSKDNTVITVRGMQESDQGTYVCQATNSVGFDTSSVAVCVQNKDLKLSVTHVANDYITVEWIGSIPRLQIANFQIFYRRSNSFEAYEKVYLHGSMHKCTLAGLLPVTSYEICLVYQEKYNVQCHNFTTDHKMAIAEPAITRISKTKIVASVCAVFGVLVVLCVARVVTRRMKKRKDYEDPLRDSGEMDKIPLEPISQAPGTPLCSSRTALLPHSQI